MHNSNRFDFLRLLAAWLVLLNHSYPLSGLPATDIISRWIRFDSSGGLAVAIFFSISGYLVTISAGKSKSIADFIYRRGIRIFPALILACIFCIFIVGPLTTRLSATDYFSNPSTWSYFVTATGFRISYFLPGVFESNPFKFAVNGSLWSLAIELQCYVVLVLLWVLPFGMRAKAMIAVFLLGILLITRSALSITDPWQTHLGLNHYDVKYGLMFALGAALAAWHELISSKGWQGLGAVGFIFLCTAWSIPDGIIQLTLYTVGMPAFTLWLALWGTLLPKIPEIAGDLSYGTYLFAFPVQQSLTHFHFSVLGISTYILYSTVITFSLAYISWHYIEQPAMKFKYRLAHR